MSRKQSESIRRTVSEGLKKEFHWAEDWVTSGSPTTHLLSHRPLRRVNFGKRSS